MLSRARERETALTVALVVVVVVFSFYLARCLGSSDGVCSEMFSREKIAGNSAFCVMVISSLLGYIVVCTCVAFVSNSYKSRRSYGLE